MPTRIINQKEVYKLLPMAECIEIMTEALKAASSGEAVFPLLRGLRVPGKNALLALMPGIASFGNAWSIYKNIDDSVEKLCQGSCDILYADGKHPSNTIY